MRNLALGRRVAGALGPVSAVGYVPDSFGHPAQLPQLLAGFGLDPFVYWRGNGTELDTLGPMYRWCAPDGTAVRAWQLPEGYFAAAGLDADHDLAGTIARLRPVIDRIVAAGGDPVLLMNGFDHLPADTSTAHVAALLGAQRVLLDEAAERLPEASTLVEWSGELVGGADREPPAGRLVDAHAVEAAQPRCGIAARRLGRAVGRVRPGIRHHRRTARTRDRLAKPVVQPGARLDLRLLDRSRPRAHGRALRRRRRPRHRSPVQRVLERLAGRNVTRDTPWTDEQEVVVFNASPTRRSDVVRVPLEGFPPWRVSVTRFDMHPFSMPAFRGVTVDGRPARLVQSDDPNRVRFLPGMGGLDVEFVATDVPAFGCRRYALAPAEESVDEVDDGRSIESGDLRVEVADDWTLSVTLGDHTYHGLFGVEDVIDRGDSYDCDPDPVRDLRVRFATVRRTRHASGIPRLQVTRELDLVGPLTVEACVAPGVPFVRCEVTLDNRETDHRLRLRFPTGASVTHFDAATTFDTAHRTTAPTDDTGWVHPAPRTFAHQGWVAANGLVVGAPGLPEAEVTPAGEILVTLVRSIGVLARIELRTRPLPAGPEMPVPGAQTPGRVAATITLARTPADARAAEVGLRGVLGGETPLVVPDVALLEVTARHSVLSSCKPAQEGDRIVVRVLNPTDEPDDVMLRFGLDVQRARPVRLDEGPADFFLTHNGRDVGFHVPPHALRTLRITFG